MTESSIHTFTPAPLTRRRFRLGAIAALALAATLSTYAGSHTLFAQDAATKPPPSAAQKEGLQHAQKLSDAFKYASKAVEPSVVNIRSTQRLEPVSRGGRNGGNGGGMQQSPLDDEMLRRFFGGEVPPGIEVNPQQQPRERTGEGSGVIMQDDGYIVTNNHVVDGATEITVTLADDSQYKGKVVGTDPDTDVAVVKIDATGLHAAKFGDSNTLDVGEWVLAVGSPFGLQHTVTAGIVSAKGRANMGLATFEDFIQTDAAINPGNSGGPLVNLQGDVIGINTAISTRTGAYNGIGFAIPSEMVKSVFQSIVSSGGVKRGALGVAMNPLDKDTAEHYGYSGGDRGVIITKVYPGSAAEKAGLKVGDIISEINGKPVTDNHALLNTIAKYEPGQSIKVTAFRNGKSKTYEVKLGDRSVQFANLNRGGGGQGGPGQAEPSVQAGLGFLVEALTPEISQELKAGDVKGVVVSTVEPDSLAAKKGMTRGDIIDMVNDQPVTSVEEFNAAVQKAASKSIALHVQRGEITSIVTLTPAKGDEGGEN